MLRRYLPDVLIVAGLLLLPLLFFAPVTLGNRTLIPADNLYQVEPWRSARDALGVPEIPHNALLSDLVLQNYQWKSFIRRSLAEGTIPLWQPNQFAGTPFLAAGQHGALYPFSLLYYVLPLPRAYGWFTVSQLWLAGALMYVFARGLRLSRAAGAAAGVAYQFSAFFIVSVVFPMMISGAAWLPLLLLMIEFVIERRPLRGDRPATVPWIALGALALMMNIFAGHVEITYYTLIVMAYWAAARLLGVWWRDRAAWRRLLRPAGSLLLMVALGVGLGAAQFLPLYELGTRNFREAAASFEQVRGYAFPARHVVKFFVPNAYGNPAQHRYRDVFTWETIAQDWQRPCEECPGGFVRVTDTDFGIKNYVEGGAYVGILTLVLAAVGLLARSRLDRVWKPDPPLRSATGVGGNAARASPRPPGPAGADLADLRLRPAHLRCAVLCLSQHQPTAYTVPLGVAVHFLRGGAGGIRRGRAAAGGGRACPLGEMAWRRAARARRSDPGRSAAHPRRLR
ncbi:MAG: hypothetical protein KatS3mg051_1362 [Anaerolineae bacterium]|nr:MAG: hypothetical protein KatS3mg051_1362 [Anaerolineae bacterium]